VFGGWGWVVVSVGVSGFFVWRGFGFCVLLVCGGRFFFFFLGLLGVVVGGAFFSFSFGWGVVFFFFAGRVL